MKRLIKIMVALLLICEAQNVMSANEGDNRVPSYIAIGSNIGAVLPTCDFVSGENAIPIYSSESIKYIFTSPGDRWQQIAYGMPYYGVGLARTQFGRSETLGDPISLYLVQGATMHTFSNGSLLNYELNLGLSTLWEPYDPFDNRENTAIGSVLNVHVAANIYYKIFLSNTLDFHIGATIFHASNGSSRQPNSGLNSAAIYFELAYNLDRKEQIRRYNPSLEVPQFDSHFEHDVQVILSSTNRKISVEEDGESTTYSAYNSYQFNVYGLNYYMMRADTYKYKYGLGAELLYDESSNASIYRKYSDIDEQWYEVTDLASMAQRLSFGLSARGEIVRPLYSIFANVGYSIIQPNDSLSRFYQSVGVKVPLQENLYGTFGVRATNFSKAQFLYWSLGYTFNRRGPVRW